MSDPFLAAHKIDAAAASEALSAWLPDRRWFQGKARTIAGVALTGSADLGQGLFDLVVEVTYASGDAEHYQLPVVVAGANGVYPGGVYPGVASPGVASPGGVLPSGPEVPVLTLRTVDGDDLVLADALVRGDTARRYAKLITHGVEREVGALGTIRGLPVSASAEELPDRFRVLRGEQSNSSVIFGDELILKVLRRLESGEHPDIELTRGLTEAGFAHIPPQIGSLVLSDAGWPTALAVLSRFVAGARDGWELTVAATTAIAAGQEPDPDVLKDLEPLGTAVGRLHRVLGQEFPSSAAGPAELSTWSHAMRTQLERVLEQARERAPDAVGALDAVENDLWVVIDRLQGMPLSEVGPMTRIHGDLHLGQTLLHPERGWQLLDFEGEPAKPLDERRRPSSPVRDVTGMLRSFDYAAAAGSAAAGHSVDDLPPAIVSWRESARRVFLDGYGETAPDALSDLQEAAPLVTAFELDKAIYELGYELANRPAWVSIPVSGIVRAIERYRDTTRRDGSDPRPP
jgi:trehalose synthase-fused probable maltokinase